MKKEVYSAIISLILLVGFVVVFSENSQAQEMICGNGIIDSEEECDDGTMCDNGNSCLEDIECLGIGDELCLPRSGDGCSSDCKIEDGFWCEDEPSECQLGCHPDDIIFRLSSATNSHAEKVGSGSYPLDICFSDIFGYSYGLTNSRSCHASGPGDNTVIRLSGNTNAHAESPDLNTAGYQDVCFGNLDCSISAGSCDPSLGYKEIVALSSSTNAHVELPYYDSGFYNQKVCCRIAGEFSEPQWKNFRGEEITESYIGNTVKMVAETTFTDAVGPVLFEIWEYDSGSPDDSIRTGENAIEGYIENGVAIGAWDITFEDMENTNNYEGFYFNMTLEGVSNLSGYLIVNQEIDPNNGNPEAIISNPLHKQIYFTNVPMNFTEESIDEEGPITEFQWSIMKNGELVNTSNQQEFTNTFIDPGEYVITLRVTDSGGLVSEDQIAVLLLESPGIFAYISSPFHHQLVSDVDDSHTLLFDASDTYVVMSEGELCDLTITCLAGLCPAITEGIPLGCEEKIELTGETEIGFEELLFSWNFGGEGTFTAMGGFEGARSYGRGSKTINDKHISLSVTYEDENIGLLSAEVDRDFTLGQCINNGGTVLLDDNDDGVFDIQRSTLEPTDVCSVDGNIGDDNDCCPPGFQCTEEGCVGTNVIRCSDYTDQASCNGDRSNVAENDPLWHELNCGQTIEGVTYQCQCAWDDSGEVDSCGLSVEALNEGGFNSSELCTHYTCLNSYIASDCNQGFITVTVDAHLDVIGGTFEDCPASVTEECSSGQYTLSCSNFITEVSFFDHKTSIFAVFAIFLIYIFLALYRKRG